MPTTSFEPSIRLYESEWEDGDEVADMALSRCKPVRN